MWQVEYEQCPRGHTWEFKFDHVPLDDGRWHRVNSTSPAVYRVEHEALQYCTPGPDIPDAEWQALLVDLKASGPLSTDDELRVIIARREDGYWMQSARPEEGQGAPVPSLTCPDLSAAYRELRRLQNQS